jgi:hypothetical protein
LVAFGDEAYASGERRRLYASPLSFASASGVRPPG